MPVTIAQKNFALNKMRELVQARINYNRVLLEDLNSNTMEENFEFISPIPAVAQIINAATSSEERQKLIVTYMDKFKDGVSYDLNFLEQLMSLINLDHTFELYISIKGYKYKEDVQYKEIRNKKDITNEFFNQISEYFLINAVDELARDNEIYSAREYKFEHDYVAYKLVDTDVAYLFDINVDNLIKDMRKLATMIDGCKLKLSKLQEQYASLRIEYESYLDNILKLWSLNMCENNIRKYAFGLNKVRKNANLIDVPLVQSDGAKVLSDYLSYYRCLEFVKELSVDIDNIVREQEKIKQEELRAQQKQQELVKAQAKISAKEAKAKSMAQAVLAQKEREDLLAQKRAQEQAALEKMRAEEKQRKAESLARLSTLRAAGEQQRIANKEERMAAIAQANAVSGVVSLDLDHKLQSSFKLPAELVEKAWDDIVAVFINKSVEYSVVVKLLADLKGVVDTSTGSSHQVVSFNGHVYGYLNGDFKSKIVRPHGDKGPNIYRWELTLFKEMICAVLPHEYLVRLQNESRVKMPARLVF